MRDTPRDNLLIDPGFPTKSFRDELPIAWESVKRTYLENWRKLAFGLILAIVVGGLAYACYTVPPEFHGDSAAALKNRMGFAQTTFLVVWFIGYGLACAPWLRRIMEPWRRRRH